MSKETIQETDPLTGSTKIDGYELACHMRDNTNEALGNILTLIEASLGESKQAESMKKLVKQTLWKLADSNQSAMYAFLGEETSYPIGSSSLPALEQ